MIAVVEPRLGWNVAVDIRQLFDYPFMVNAFRAGTVVAIAAAVVGWFVVARRQTFAAHTLAVIGFPGASGAVLIGVSAQLGLYTFCIAGAVVIALLPAAAGRGRREEPAVIGIVQAVALACGYLFVRLYRGNLGGVNALLFGNFLGVTSAEVVALAVGALVAVSGIALMARPLLFASIDADVAAARGVPVRVLSVAFTVLLGIAVAAAVQVTGALLVFALLVLPAATAQTLTPRLARGAIIAVFVGVAVTWLGLGVAYYSTYPIGFWISTFAFAAFVAARGVARVGQA